MDIQANDFSAEEMAFSSNAAFMRMKNNLMGKVVNRFSAIAEELQKIHKEYPFNDISLNKSPKISKGEQYLGLPYMMLDYPRAFSKYDVFAIRSMWWWGNDYSLTLHLKGKYQQNAAPALKQSYAALSEFYISNSQDEWDHNLQGSGYISMNEISDAAFALKIKNDYFLKLAMKFPLSSWNRADEFIPASFRTVMSILY